MLQLDERIDEARLQQFASQVHELSPSTRQFMSESFGGNESPEFYAGLVAGLAAAYQLGQLTDHLEYIGAAVATAAEHALRKPI